MRRPRNALGSLLALLVAGMLALPALAAADPALPPGFQDETVFSGIEQPTNFRFAPDGRVFVAEKPGRILVYENVNDPTPEVFAELRGDVYDNGDRGLLGLALDPGIDSGRPYVYALYTWDHVLGEPWDPAKPKYGTPGVPGDPSCPAQNSSGSCLVSGRLVKLTEDPLNPNKALQEAGRPKQEQLLEGWCQQFSSHSIGEVEFGPEGALYVSGGDGASYESIPDWGQLGTGTGPSGFVNACGDPPSAKGTAPLRANARGGALRSQNPDLLNGKILRIDPDTGAPFPGNPITTGTENAQRTVAMGFRNPFRFTLDPTTGELYSGIVGSSEIEEIDRFPIAPSERYNSGWPCYEGTEPQYQFVGLGIKVCEDLYKTPGSTAKPFFSYSHRQTVVPDDECPTASGSAVGGVSFYRGSQFPPAYKGAFFFADSVRGCVWVMKAGADGKPDPTTTERFLREGRIYPGVEIAEGPDGYLYYADLFSDEGAGEGEIHRVAYKPTSPTARLVAEPPYGLYSAGKFETTLKAGGSSDPQGQALTYEWDLDESGTFVAGGPEKTVTFTKAEQEAREGVGNSPNRVIAVRVENPEGLTSIARVTVYPGDKPPVAKISEPSSSLEWAVGDQIDLAGEAKDAQGNPINFGLRYYWITRLAHCPDPSQPTACHVHPLQTISGYQFSSLIAPQHDYPSYIEILLRVSDERDLQSEPVVLKLQPKTVDVSLESDPPGIPLSVASTEAAAPFAIKSIDGAEIQLVAPESPVLACQRYRFVSWSDKGPREHPVLTDEDLQLTANFELLGPEPNCGGGGGENGGGENGGGTGGGTGGGDTGGGKVDQPPPPPPVTVVPAPKMNLKPAKQTSKRVAKFGFAAAGAPAYQCRLDKKKWAPCRSPRTYRGLAPGPHTFRVRAAGSDGSPLTKATAYSWKVVS
jgi:glucose/arabinose dehydrogenase